MSFFRAGVIRVTVGQTPAAVSRLDRMSDAAQKFFLFPDVDAA
jgi:hypothetical protein